MVKARGSPKRFCGGGESMRGLFRTLIVFACLGQVGAAQQVPEGIHQIAEGPAEMCGLVGQNAAELVERARQSSSLKATPIDSDRFEFFATEDHSYQLVATLPSEPAYPAVSCRHTYEKDGALRMARSMRCDAGRAECDALFLEFQELDAEMTRRLRGED